METIARNVNACECSKTFVNGPFLKKKKKCLMVVLKLFVFFNMDGHLGVLLENPVFFIFRARLCSTDFSRS